jgi:uncharacterized membrane protein YhaH (DUF805 family)
MEEKLTVSDTVKKWGLIYGIVGLIYMLLSTMLDFATMGMMVQVISFLVLVGIASTIYFLACKEYRDSNEGQISFGRAFGIIALVAVIGGVIRAIGIYAYIKFIDTGYMARVQEAQEEMRSRFGAPEVDTDDLPAFVKFFQTEEFLGIATFFNVMIGALIIGLIVAAMVQKKEDHSY